VSVHVGLDLGKEHDYTALAVVLDSGAGDGGRRERPTQRRNTGVLSRVSGPARIGGSSRRYQLTDLRRYELGTDYVDIVPHVVKIMNDSRLTIDGVRPMLYVDSTGVGAPVVEMLRSSGLGDLIAIKFRPSSEDARWTQGNREGRIPKEDVVAALRVAWQQKQVAARRGMKLWPTLRNELSAFKRKQNEKTGSVTYEHWRQQDHDDLVFAVAMAIYGAQYAPGSRPVFIERMSFGPSEAASRASHTWRVGRI